MKLAAALVLVSSLAYAGPEKADRKGNPTDKYTAAAGEAFGKALAADEKGDLEGALRFYRKAFEIQPHPNCQYNIADVQRRRKDYDGAITAYKKYLEMDPTAKDKPAVDKIIRELEAMPGTMIIEIEESNAKVFLEGEPIKVKPVPDKRKPDVLTYTIDLPELRTPSGSPKSYSVDVITAISHENENCYVYRGSKRECRIRLRPRQDGNVIISGPHGMSRASIGYNGETTQLKGRFARPAGKQELYVDRDRQCKPMTVNVAPGDAVTYVWADVPDKWPERRDGCYDLKYRVTVLKF
jgi:tetratricopeptide (TPR) repeat protein